jgi:hypothetical protein
MKRDYEGWMCWRRSHLAVAEARTDRTYPRSLIIDHRSSLDYLRFLVGDLFSLFSYLRSVEYYCENPKVLAKDKNLGVRYTRPQPFLFSG